MTVIRMTLVATAVAACAWFVLGAVQAHELDQAGNAAALRSLSPARVRSALSQLEAAATLNPDRTVDIVRAQVIAAGHDKLRAERILDRVVGDEPMNLAAWFQLGAIGGDDPAIVRRALDHIAVLLPSLRPKPHH